MMDGITRLILVRHGDTVDEETKKIYKGNLDIPLSEKGRLRIGRAARFLASFRLDHVYASALSRCVESASIIAEPRGLPLTVMPGLNEIRLGRWEGLSFDEIAGGYPEEFRSWMTDPEKNSPPGGETLSAVQERVLAATQEILDRHRGQGVALVAHAGVLRIIVCSVLDLKLSRLFRLAQDCGGISIIDRYDDNNAVIKLLNFTLYE